LVGTDAATCGPPALVASGPPIGQAGAMGPHVGDAAPEIDLTTPDGRSWRLSDVRGRPALVVFHRHLA
jgi:hypothetical protein